MKSEVVFKKPQEVLDYDVKFCRWLPEGDTIVSVSVAAALTPSTSTIVVDSSSIIDGETAKVWLSGGLDGESALVTVVATTDDGRDKKACFRLKIKDCS